MIANEERSWITGILQSLMWSEGDQVTIIVTQSNSNLFLLHIKEIRISLKNNDFYQSSFTSQMVTISMTLDWRANEHTEKLPVSR